MSEFNAKRIQAEIRSMEAMSMTERQIAEKLNAQGLKTGGGNEWNGARLASFKAHLRTKMQVRATKVPKPAWKLPKIAKKPVTGGGPADDMAVLALRRTDWSDQKKLRVVSAILAE